MRAVADVARVRIFDDEVDERSASELRRQLPRCRLVDEHQRRLDGDLRVETERNSVRQAPGSYRCGSRDSRKSRSRTCRRRAFGCRVDRRAPPHRSETTDCGRARTSSAGPSPRSVISVSRVKRRIADALERRRGRASCRGRARPTSPSVASFERMTARCASSTMALAVREADRLDALIAFERPGQADG